MELDDFAGLESQVTLGIPSPPPGIVKWEGCVGAGGPVVTFTQPLLYSWSNPLLSHLRQGLIVAQYDGLELPVQLKLALNS